MNEKRKEITSTHPLFKIDTVRLFWLDNVKKFDRHGSYQDRILAITSIGVFLFKQAIFPRSLKLSRVISYEDIVLIYVTSDQAGIFGPNKTIRFDHPRKVMIAAMAKLIRDALFGDFPRPPKIQIEEQYKEEFYSTIFKFETVSPIADRFLSMCLSVKPELISIDQINDFYQILKPNSKSIHITYEQVTSPLILPFCLAIAYDYNVEMIRFWKVNIPSIIPCISPILLNSASITQITFSSISFIGDIKILEESIQRHIKLNPSIQPLFHCNKIRFSDCNFTTQGANDFLSLYAKYHHTLETIIIDNSTFNAESLVALKNCIKGSNKTLVELQLTMKDTDELFDVEFEKLETLGLRENQMQGNQLLQEASSNLSTVKTIQITKNVFTESDFFFGNLSEIDFSESTFEGNSLVNMLEAISNTKNSIISIILNSITYDENNFFEDLPSIYLKGVQTISFQKNRMNKERMDKFVEFVKHNTSIVNLALSGSIDPFAAADEIEKISLLLESRPFESFVLQGSQTNRLGSALIPLIKKAGRVKCLDVSYQSIGDQGIQAISSLIGGPLEELSIDGSNPSSFEVFLAFYKYAIKTKGLTVEWPQYDEKQILATVSNDEKEGVQTKLNELKKELEVKVVQEPRITMYSSGVWDSFEVIRRRRMSQSIRDIPSGKTNFDKSILMTIDPDIEKLVDECLTQEQIDDEPMNNEFSLLEKMFSIETFLAEEES